MYTDTASVTAEFKNIDTASGTMVTGALIDEWIEIESQFIDSQIGQRYQTPIDETLNPQSFLILKKIATALVADRVRGKLAVKTSAASLKTDSSGSSNDQGPEMLIQAIRKGTLILTDAVQLGVLIHPTGTTERKWKSDEDQW